MNKTKKVSIITVTYNATDTIEQTIHSVLNQSYENIEYIIVDGMSTDGTWEKICKYKEKISILVHEKDNGLYDAMNKGISMATGEIIGIINGDDWYEKDAVQNIVKEFHNNVDVLYGKLNVIGSDNSVVKVSNNVCIEDIWYNMIPHSTVFVKTQIYRDFGRFNLNYSIVADYDLILRFYVEHVRFRYIDKVLANFRQGGLTTNKWLDCAKEVKKVSMTYIDKCPEKNKYLKKINEKYNRTLIRAAYEMSDDKFRESLDELLCHKTNTICIFGAGIWGKRCADKLIKNGFSYNCFIDNNPDKQGTKIDAHEVISLDELGDMECSVIIAVSSGYDEIAGQLKELKNPKLQWIQMFDLYKDYQ